MINIRDLSYGIIYDVKINKKYSNILINNTIKKYNLDFEQRSFMTFLVYEVLSRINYLDFFIKKYSSIGFSKISKQARIVLEMAIFELAFMNSSVDYASVNEAVKLIKKHDSRAASFVNAMLRKITSNPENIQEMKNYSFDEIKDDREKYLSVKYSVSEYIAKRFLQNYSFDFCEQILQEMQKSPKIFIRANRLKTDFESFKNSLDELNLSYEVVDKENMIFALDNFKNIANTKIYKEGLFNVQDYASMQAVLKLNPQKDENIIDVCAAPGGKSIFISELMQNTGNVLSLDISLSKLSLLKDQTKRLGINNINIRQNDATEYNPDFAEKFDRVLVDAPCSGLGILRRKPEIRYKKQDEIEGIENIQKMILENSARYLKKGGSMVYSTCTLGDIENRNVAEEFVKNNEGYDIRFQKEYYPNVDKTDGFYICLIEKK